MFSLPAGLNLKLEKTHHSNSRCVNRCLSVTSLFVPHSVERESHGLAFLSKELGKHRLVFKRGSRDGGTCVSSLLRVCLHVQKTSLKELGSELVDPGGNGILTDAHVNSMDKSRSFLE